VKLSACFLSVAICSIIWFNGETVAQQPYKTPEPWSRFQMSKFSDAKAGKNPIVLFSVGNTLIGAEKVSVPTLGVKTQKLLQRRGSILFAVEISDFANMPDRFIDRYLTRSIPALTIIPGDGRVYKLSGEFDTLDVQQFVEFVLKGDSLPK